MNRRFGDFYQAGLHPLEQILLMVQPTSQPTLRTWNKCCVMKVRVEFPRVFFRSFGLPLPQSWLIAYFLVLHPLGNMRGDGMATGLITWWNDTTSYWLSLQV